MKELNIPVGISSFAVIRENGYYYIDKTGLISELIRTNPVQVTLITRPRRFGKTLAMSMLSEFFDIRKDNKEMFAGLEISENRKICEEWMNQYPTLFLSFKDIDGLKFESAYGLLEIMISNLCKEHAYLEHSHLIDEADRMIFNRLKLGIAKKSEVQTSLSTIMRMMQAYYGRKIIILLDEYDVPIAKASRNGYYEQMIEIIRTMMGTALKDNDSLRFAVITGCLRIVKESIFTGTNNFVIDTISDNRFSQYFGFTQKEVEKILVDTECEVYADKIKQWYDGYHFGDTDIYCPWDVLNYINKVLTSGVERPENFWENTSDNAIVGDFLQREDLEVTEKFETLLAGNYIKEHITENLTYDILESDESNLWSLLYLTGYLTKVKKEEILEDDNLGDGQIALAIPNVEVMDIFKRAVVKWFNCKSAHSDRREFFRALWSGNAEKLTELLSDLLFDTISFHNYAESFYHAFMVGLFSSAGYIVESNYENGLGRSDVTIKDRKNRRAVVIEAKIASSENTLERECMEALKQIEEKGYARKIERSGYRIVLRFGVSFYQKTCLAKLGVM